MKPPQKLVKVNGRKPPVPPARSTPPPPPTPDKKARPKKPPLETARAEEPEEPEEPEELDSSSPTEVLGSSGEVLLSHDEAAEYMGLTLRAFRRRFEAGKYDSARVLRKNKVLFSQAELDRLKYEGDQESALNSVLHLLRTSLETSHRQNREMLAQTLKVTEEQNRTFISQRQTDVTRISELEAKLSESFKLREEAAAEVHRRELERMKYEKSEKRIDAAWDKLLEWGPLLAEQMAGAQQFRKLVEKFTPQQVEALLDPGIGFFTDEQRAQLQFVLNKWRETSAKRAKVEQKTEPKTEQPEKTANGKSSQEKVEPS